MGLIGDVAKPGLVVAGYAAVVAALIKSRVKVVLGGQASLLKRLLSAYAAFALSHHLYKILWVFRVYCRAVIGWRKVPGKIDRVDMPGMRDNLHRLNDYRFDCLKDHLDKPLVKSTMLELVCCSPESVEWMLNKEFLSVSKANARTDIAMQLLKEWIGEGVFVLRHGRTEDLLEEHKKWFFQRKTASKIFTKSNFMNLMSETFEEKAEQLIQSLDKVCERKGDIDIQKEFFSFTMDSIQKIFFGREVNTMGEEKSDEYANAYDNAHRAAMQELMEAIPIAVLSTGVLPFPLGDVFALSSSSALWNIRRTYFSKHIKELRKCVATLDSIAYKVIREARADPKLENRRDMLANFLNGKDGKNLSDKHLRDLVLNMTIAGRDTTACTLSWMVYILTQNQDVQAQLCKEIDEKLQGRTPTLEDLNPKNMPYLNGVLYETLRLYPPVPEDEKVVTEDGLVYPDGTPVYKGTHLIFSPYSMGRNPKVYPDPLKVVPTRWIPFKTPDPYAFPVFQAGPRFCLGKDMAQFEAKFLIAKLLQKFTFTLRPGEAEKITYSLMITLSVCNSKKQDSHNLWVVPHRR